MSDRLQFNPHSAFVRSLTDEDRSAYRQLMQQPHVRAAITNTVAEMARRGFSREQLDGALHFIEMFQNFAEPEEQPKPLPIKTLKPT